MALLNAEIYGKLTSDKLVALGKNDHVEFVRENKKRRFIKTTYLAQLLEIDISLGRRNDFTIRLQDALDSVSKAALDFNRPPTAMRKQ